jgi:hypothetical protein
LNQFDSSISYKGVQIRGITPQAKPSRNSFATSSTRNHELRPNSKDILKKTLSGHRPKPMHRRAISGSGSAAKAFEPTMTPPKRGCIPA